MKRSVIIFTVMTMTLGVVLGFSTVSADPASDTKTTDLNVSVGEVIQLNIGNCGTTAARAVSMSVGSGGFSSCKISVEVGTNAEGYKLFINSVDTTTYHVSANGLGEDLTNKYFDGSTDGATNLVLVTSEIPSTVIDTTKFIPPFTATTAAPAAMSNLSVSAWGFAVPNTQGSIAAFDSSYAIYADTSSAATGKYAAVPTAQTQIRARTGAVNSQVTDVYFGTRVSSTQVPGDYKGVVLFSAVGEAPSTSGGSGDNNVGAGGQIGGQDITRTPADAGTGTYQPHELTYVDTADGTPEPTGPAGVTKTKSASIPAASQQVNSTLSLVAGAVLVGAVAWLLALLLGKKFDVLLLAVGTHKHKVAETVKHYTKLTAADSVLYDVFEEMSGKPLLLIEKISKRRATKISKALENDGAEAKIRAHRQPKKKRQ
jgi:ribosomal protein L7/L12